MKYYSYECMKEKIISTGADYISCDRYDFKQKLTAADGKRIGGDISFAIEVLVCAFRANKTVEARLYCSRFYGTMGETYSKET